VHWQEVSDAHTTPEVDWCGGVFLKPALATVAQDSATASVTPPASAPVLKMPWGALDLQGIWTDEFDTPLQRPAKYANQEFFTEAQRQELDKQRAELYGSDPRQERGSAVDVGGAYNTAFLTIKHAGARTSLIVDQLNGRIPPLTPEAQKAAAADRQLAWHSCNQPKRARTRGPYVPAASTTRRLRRDSPNSLRATTPVISIASTVAMAPEDDGLADRCLYLGIRNSEL